ncbi:SCO family protein [uncultured Roseovarius sp.]|uniref:SCO family protein n=1 Tax=uncultured Roseovarius sp. TaxID=293344 RepID=UPI002609AA16|nr:SCO family protein [uncultured Roseovarius sp.]
MTKTMANLRIAPAHVLGLAFLAFAASNPAMADHPGHDMPAEHSHDHQTGHSHTDDHGSDPDVKHGQADSMAGHADHTAGHGDHTADHADHGDHAADHGDHAAMDHRMPDHLGMDDANTQEAAMRPDGFQYKRGFNDYEMPALTLRNQGAQKVNFAELMEYDGPVLLNFIFTSCATICPVMSATFGQTQQDLATIDDNYLMVSISIDPEYDTPRRLRDYAVLHDARDNWVMLTGQFDDIFSVVRAFDAVYKGENKMYHRPLTFLRAGADAPWLRLEGLLSSEELAEEYAQMLRPEVN